MAETYSISSTALEQYCLSVYKDRFYHIHFPKVENEITSNLRKAKKSSLGLEDIFKRHKFSFSHPEEIKLKEYNCLVYICREVDKKLLAVLFSNN